MNKVQQDSYAIEQAFAKGKAFIGFLTAGDPNLEATARYIKVMADAGADLVEIGIPFSDPVAEGEVIQRASQRALKSGALTDAIFAMVQKVRETVTIPLVVHDLFVTRFMYMARKNSLLAAKRLTFAASLYRTCLTKKKVKLKMWRLLRELP